jgi:hypothetical protein
MGSKGRTRKREEFQEVLSWISEENGEGCGAISGQSGSISVPAMNGGMCILRRL